MVQGKINRGRQTDHPAGHHSIRTNQCPPPPSPQEIWTIQKKLSNTEDPVHVCDDTHWWTLAFHGGKDLTLRCSHSFTAHKHLYIITIISPHHSTMYVDATNRVACYVSLSPCKNGWTDWDAVWVEDSGGLREPCIRWGSRCPHGNGQFFGEKGRSIVNCEVLGTLGICAKAAEPIEMPFGLWVQMGQGNTN